MYKNIDLISNTRLSANPIDLQNAKSWLRVSHSTDDTLIIDLIEDTTTLIEHITQNSLTDMNYVVRFSREFVEKNGYEISLPYGSINTVNSVTDDAGNPVEYERFGVNEIRIIGEFADDYVEIDYDVVTVNKAIAKLAILQSLAITYQDRGDADLLDKIKGLSSVKKIINTAWF